MQAINEINANLLPNDGKKHDLNRPTKIQRPEPHVKSRKPGPESHSSAPPNPNPLLLPNGGRRPPRSPRHVVVFPNLLLLQELALARGLPTGVEQDDAQPLAVGRGDEASLLPPTPRATYVAF
jgi:hypothetical protein